ncbi:MAG: transposase [Desulfobacterota bacterium]|jgi:putative transposase|nr:transposase [Thermodesulfobacteriota bacterium]
MTGSPRVVVPGCPHHVTQRGNRRQRVFFRTEDFRTYRDLMAHWCHVYGVEIWCYCLMPNHVHLLAVPSSGDGLARVFGQAHRRYTRMINARHGWRGHLWQGRFSSAVVDGEALLATARYIEMNPVRASLVRSPEEYEWSSAGVHVNGRFDVLARGGPFRELTSEWKEFLERGTGTLGKA